MYLAPLQYFAPIVTIVEQLWLHKLRTCAWVSQVRQSAALTISGWLKRFHVTESLSLKTRNSVAEAEIQHSCLKATVTSVIHPTAPSSLTSHSQQAFVHQLWLLTRDPKHPVQ